MQLKDFLYFLTDKDGRCYKTDEHENVIVNSEIVPIRNSPDGWQEKRFLWTRHTVYQGVVRELALALKFVTDGATIVRNLFYNYMIQADLYLRIAKLNRSTGVHEKFYVGAFDFSTFVDDDQLAQINILDSGAAAKIQAYDETEYAIEMTDDNTVNVQLDGIDLKKSVNYGLLEENQFHNIKVVPIFQINEEGSTAETLALHDPDPEHEITDFDTDTNWIVSALSNVSVKYTGHLVVDIQYLSKIEIYFKKSTGQKYIVYQDLNPPQDAFQIAFDVDIEIPLTSGDKLFFVSDTAANTGGGGKFSDVENSKLKAVYASRYRPTFCKAFRPSFLFQEFITRMTGLTNNTVSNLLEENDNRNGTYTILLTSGDAIRQISGAKFKGEFRDFFKFTNIVMGAGLSIENEKVYLEGNSFIFSNEVVGDLGEVAALKGYPDTDNMYNTIKVGYQDQTYDDVNGKDEFNTTQQYSTAITRIKKEMDLICPYRADMYGIEFTRINLDGKDTTDSDSDNDIFILVCNSQPVLGSGLNLYYTLYRGPYNVTGLISPETAFNIPVSPKHLLLKNGTRIHSILDKLDSTNVTFQSSAKNSELSVTVNGITVTENTDVPVSDLMPKLYRPYIFEIDVNVPFNIMDWMNNNPRGLMKFTWRGQQYTGYVVDVEYQPTYDNPATFKLLAGPDNDLTKLIKHGQ